MCSLELYNWYENRFPDQFNQLIKIKHYNISELSFLLSKVWYRLDFGEKLLMCAVYNDDFNLARQMLNENIMFRVNPFLSKRYMSTSYFERKARFSSSTSINHLDESVNVNRSDNNSNSDDQTCWCYNADTQSLFKYRPSVSSIQDWLISASNDEELFINTAQINSSSSSSSQDDTSIKLNLNSSSSPALSYFFNQRLQENQIYSPFYLAIKLNKLKMCQLFVDYMKQAYYSHYSALHRIQSKHNTGMPVYYMHHTKCGLKGQPGVATRCPTRVYLSHFLDEPELVNLFVATLMNRNYDLAVLILNNCEKPKMVLNFYNLSESFIKSKEFCLYLARARLVEPNVLLKVATNRHQYQTTCHLLDYFESVMSIDKSVSSESKSKSSMLCDLYKIVLFNSISIGDFPIFSMILERVCKNLCAEKRDSLLGQITIDGILRKKYTPGMPPRSLAARKRSSGGGRSSIDPEAVKSLALSNNFDFDAFITKDSATTKPAVVHLPTLTYVNRIKMIKYLFSDPVTTKSPQSTDSLKKSLNDWSQLEVYLDKKLEHFRECFETKPYYMNEYYIIDDSEPYIIKKFIETKEYKVTRSDLISVAQSSLSELTFYYLLASLDFEQPQNWPLLAVPDDNDDENGGDKYSGNFVEILFCRLVRGSNANPEQETRLRRLLFEMIILNNAKLTCSLNMLSLFMTRNQFTKQRLVEFYFPALFFLAKSVNLFQSDVFRSRFELLTSWLFQSTIQLELASSFGLTKTTGQSMSQEQLELVISQYYSYLSTRESNDNDNNKKETRSKKFRVNLCEMSRDVFMRSYLASGKSSEDKLLNLISETTRRFIFYMNEIKNLF